MPVPSRAEVFGEVIERREREDTLARIMDDDGLDAAEKLDAIEDVLAGEDAEGDEDEDDECDDENEGCMTAEEVEAEENEGGMDVGDEDPDGYW